MRTSPPISNNSAGLAGSGLGSPGGQRLPVPPRERKPALAMLAVLLILGGALASAYLVMQSGQRVAAIQITAPVAAGQKVPASALTEVQIGDTGISYISWSEVAKVTQAYAAVDLVKGGLLTNEMLRAAGDPASGRAVVGLSLKAGQVPATGLVAGQHVALYGVSTGGSNAQNATAKAGLLVADAIVYYSGRARGSGSLTSSDQVTVDVAVPPDQAAAVAQAAAAGQVAAVLLPTSVQVPTGQQGGATPSNPAGTP